MWFAGADTDIGRVRGHQAGPVVLCQGRKSVFTDSRRVVVKAEYDTAGRNIWGSTAEIRAGICKGDRVCPGFFQYLELGGELGASRIEPHDFFLGWNDIMPDQKIESPACENSAVKRL